MRKKIIYFNNSVPFLVGLETLIRHEVTIRGLKQFPCPIMFSQTQEAVLEELVVDTTVPTVVFSGSVPSCSGALSETDFLVRMREIHPTACIVWHSYRPVDSFAMVDAFINKTAPLSIDLTRKLSQLQREQGSVYSEIGWEVLNQYPIVDCIEKILRAESDAAMRGAVQFHASKTRAVEVL